MNSMSDLSRVQVVPSGTFASRENASRTAIALETAFNGAYLGAIRALDSVELKVVAGQIAPTSSAA